MFRIHLVLFLLPAVFVTAFSQSSLHAERSFMYFGDTTRTGIPFSKDPHVTSFGGRYLMYYSIQPYRDKDNPVSGWGIGIAESRDLVN